MQQILQGAILVLLRSPILTASSLADMANRLDDRRKIR
jgi:hypothetical protein